MVTLMSGSAVRLPRTLPAWLRVGRRSPREIWPQLLVLVLGALLIWQCVRLLWVVLTPLSPLGAWQPQYGSAGDGMLGVNDGTGSDPASIAIATAGYYEFTVNLEDMTYTLTPYDASAAPSFNSVGIIGAGSPGGWDADTVLTTTAANPHIWHGSGIAITAAAVKFRANASWDLPGNWGGGTPISGQVSVNGGDFVPVVDAGTYDIWFNDLDGRYIFIAVN